MPPLGPLFHRRGWQILETGQVLRDELPKYRPHLHPHHFRLRPPVSRAYHPLSNADVNNEKAPPRLSLLHQRSFLYWRHHPANHHRAR